MIKVSDFIAQRVAELGIRDIFMVTGGGAMHLNDSFGNNNKLNYFCFHHEQACAIAAEGYYRTSHKLPLVNVTTGPGGTNAITGVLGQWTDSIPAIYISGNVKFETTIAASPELDLRQLGDQEVNIVSVVKPLVKYAKMVTDPTHIKKEIDKAYHLATSGRPGPVWLDIPLNIQGDYIDPSQLEDYDSKDHPTKTDYTQIDEQIITVIEKLKAAKAPAIFAGYGVRLSNSEKYFYKLIRDLNIPVLTSISGHDLIDTDDPLFFGRPGICGDRLGNMAIQNCDLLLVLGTRMGIRQTTFNFKDFARNAFKIMVDIDDNELNKPTLFNDLNIHSDLQVFLKKLTEKIDELSVSINTAQWINWGMNAKQHLPTMMDDNPSKDGYVSSYLFAKRLFELLPPSSQVVTGNGTAYTCTYQVMPIQKDIKVFANQGCASMGYGLPAAIGASIARNGQEIILITGDGSIMMNLQELQTLVGYHLPIKIFLLENQGYGAIRTTQKSFFSERYVGESPESRVSLPQFDKIAQAFGLKHYLIDNEANLDDVIQKTLNEKEATICEIKMDPFQTLFPKVSSYKGVDGKMYSKPMEDMAPFISDSLRQTIMSTLS